MARTYLLWASGSDQPGIVAAVTGTLFQFGCNLEDSSMMRLGSEFGMFLIFTAPGDVPHALSSVLRSVEKKFKLNIGLKPLTRAEARFAATKGEPAIVSVHGPDRRGLVFRVTEQLARLRFNITDLSTHRTTRGPRPGFILLIEGEIPRGKAARITTELRKLEKKLKTRITLRPVPAQTL